MSLDKQIIDFSFSISSQKSVDWDPAASDALAAAPPGPQPLHGAQFD